MFRAGTILSTVLLSGSAFASIFYVAPSGNDAANGLTAGNAKRTIQATINAAVAGDEIRLAQGTYFENVTIAAGVTIKGGWRAGFAKRNITGYPSVIDGQAKGVVVTVSALPAAQTIKIDGVTIQRGTQGFASYNANVSLTNDSFLNNFAPASVDGAGIAVDSDGKTPINATITGNLVANNWDADQIGGAYVYLSGGSGTVSNNRILHNGSSVYIGGMLLVGGTFLSEYNDISDNTTGGNAAGAMLLQGTFTFRNNRITHNNGIFAVGVYVISSTCDFLGNLVAHNTATGFNCGLAFRSSNGHILNNTFADNVANYPQYGVDTVVLFSPDNTPMTPEVANNIFANNGAAGLAWNYPAVVKPIFHHNCFAGNDGVDQWYYDTPGFTEQPLGKTDTGRTPLFMDAEHDDYRLHPQSPARDTGDNAALTLLTKDLDQQPRRKGAYIDMGAYECGPGGSLLFHDTFQTSAPGLENDPLCLDINFEYTKRQLGSAAPIKWVEDPETATGSDTDFMSQVSNSGRPTLLLCCWPFCPTGARPNTSAAPGTSFTQSPNFEVSMEFGPYYKINYNTSHWMGFSFGDAARVAPASKTDTKPGGPCISDGTGVTFQIDGSLVAYDGGKVVYQTNILGDYNARFRNYPISFRVSTNGAFDGSGVVTWTLYSAGRPLFTYHRPRGYVGNVITTAVYSDPAFQWYNQEPANSAAADLFWHVDVRAIDLTPPTTTVLPDHNPTASGWYRDDVVWTVTATDEAGGSGVREIKVSLDRGKTWKSYPGTKAAVAGVGQGDPLQFLYYPVDNAGNAGPVQTRWWWVDETGSPTTIQVSPAPNGAGWNQGDVTATLSAPDDALSYQRLYYAIDGGATNNYTTPIAFTGEGKFTLTGWTFDQAENKGPVATQAIWIDRTSPTITSKSASPSLLSNLGTGQMVSVNLTVLAADALSGVGSISYAVADVLGTVHPSGTMTLGADKKYHATISLEAYRTSNQSRYTVTFTPTDKAGNVGAPVTLVIKVK